MKNNGHWLYIHKSLCGTENVWKIGVTITPYSAVRARQRHCWTTFGLDYLWFGHPDHVGSIENELKEHFKSLSAAKLNNTGNTELFNINVNALLERIELLIKNNQLLVARLHLPEPYTAVRSKDCPFGVPSELECESWCNDLLDDTFSKDVVSNADSEIFLCKNTFYNLFG